MSASRHRLNAAVGVVAGAALALAGCSSTDDAGPTDQPATPAAPVVTPVLTPVVTPVVTPPADEVTTVMVTETEFAIELSQETFAPGTYTFEVANEGGTTHDLLISGPGVEASTSMISGGGNDSFTVTLASGTYELWCSVGSHKLQGMDLTITVG